MAQIIRITSEALQSTIRRLLPSQQGFGEDLQASNVIQPIIDLTPSAEGSETRQDLQSALAFGSITAFSVFNGSSTVVNTPGFFRVFGVANLESTTSAQRNLSFSLTDGLATKKLVEFTVESGADGQQVIIPYDFVVFLRSGDSLTASSTSNQQTLNGCTRQIATVTGELVDPIGYTPQ